MSLGWTLWTLSFPVAVILGLALAGGARSRWLLGVGGAIAVAGLAGDALRGAEQRALAQYRPVEAVVVVSERGARANAWRFAYEYEFAGETRRGSRLGHRPRLRGRDDTDAMAAAYPLGHRFTVYVDPRDPTRAVADPRPGYALPAAGLLLHGFLLAAVLAALRRARDIPGSTPSPAGA